MDLPDRELWMLGVDFGSAALSVRESLSYTPEDAVDLLRAAADVPGLEEVVVVSTCNRTEFYLVTADNTDVSSRWLRVVRERRPQAPIGDDRCVLSRARGLDAARHLLRVGCGLESALLGDAHIIGQLKRALALAGRAGTLGPVLNRVFGHAFTAFAASRQLTAIGKGHPSLGSAVAGLIGDRVGPLPDVLLLGAGVAARDIGRQLAKWRLGTLTIMNRTADSATEFARHTGATARPWAELDDAIDEADVVVAATSARTPLLDSERLRQALERRSGRPLLLIDVGVPRNTESIAGVPCVTVDDIAARRDDALTARRLAVPRVEAIIAAELDNWTAWLSARPTEALFKRVFLGEQRARLALVDDLIASGYPGTVDELNRRIALSWRPVLDAHAREMRAWIRRNPPNTPTGALGRSWPDAQPCGEI